MVLQGFEHFVRDFFGHVAPERNDLVVALAVGDCAVEVLLLHLDDFAFRRIHELYLVARNEHVVDADGDTGLGRVREAQLLQLVEQDDGSFESVVQVREVHQLLHTLLLQQTVDEGHLRRQIRIENHAADGGLDELALHLHRFGVRNVLVVVCRVEVDHFARVAQTNRSKQFDFAGFERQHNFV